MYYWFPADTANCRGLGHIVREFQFALHRYEVTYRYCQVVVVCVFAAGEKQDRDAQSSEGVDWQEPGVPGVRHRWAWYTAFQKINSGLFAATYLLYSLCCFAVVAYVNRECEQDYSNYSALIFMTNLKRKRNSMRSCERWHSLFLFWY